MNKTDEERRIRQISRIILNGWTVEEIKKNYPTYYEKEKMVIKLAHFFHMIHT
jgi:hypothetical protein